jgi:hypothetical protein
MNRTLCIIGLVLVTFCASVPMSAASFDGTYSGTVSPDQVAAAVGVQEPSSHRMMIS